MKKYEEWKAMIWFFVGFFLYHFIGKYTAEILFRIN